MNGPGIEPSTFRTYHHARLCFKCIVLFHVLTKYRNQKISIKNENFRLLFETNTFFLAYLIHFP